MLSFEIVSQWDSNSREYALAPKLINQQKMKIEDSDFLAIKQ